MEESEVDPFGKTVRCTTRNLDHVKVMQVEESVVLRQQGDRSALFPFICNCRVIYRVPFSKTLQRTEARIVSRFGWGLSKRIEHHGLTRFQANILKVFRI